MLAVLAVTLACTGGDLPPSAPPDQLRPALRCLVNQARANIGVGPLRGSRKLRIAAQALADDMVARDYFAHGDLMSRMLAAGFEQPFRTAEALAAGCGGLATPAAVVSALMVSPPHREILLSPDLRRMAIAVVPWAHGAGACPDPGTWVLDLVGPA